MKKLFTISLITLLAGTLLSACGVPQEDYDVVANNLVTAQAEIATLKADLAASEEELAALYSDFEGLNTEYENLDAEIVSIINEFYATLEAASPYKDILVELSGPAITGDGLMEPGTQSAIEAYVIEANDAELQAKFDTWVEVRSDRGRAYDFFWYALIQVESRIFAFAP